jgi:hypothetical protein
MKPLQKFWDDTMLLRMLLKLVEHFEVLLVNRLVGDGREVNVSFLATTPLVDEHATTLSAYLVVFDDMRYWCDLRTQCTTWRP